MPGRSKVKNWGIRRRIAVTAMTETSSVRTVTCESKGLLLVRSQIS